MSIIWQAYCPACDKLGPYLRKPAERNVRLRDSLVGHTTTDLWTAFMVEHRWCSEPVQLLHEGQRP